IPIPHSRTKVATGRALTYRRDALPPILASLANIFSGQLAQCPKHRLALGICLRTPCLILFGFEQPRYFIGTQLPLSHHIVEALEARPLAGLWHVLQTREVLLQIGDVRSNEIGSSAVEVLGNRLVALGNRRADWIVLIVRGSVAQHAIAEMVDPNEFGRHP